jgi:hypothetical protein
MKVGYAAARSWVAAGKQRDDVIAKRQKIRKLCALRLGERRAVTQIDLSTKITEKFTNFLTGQLVVAPPRINGGIADQIVQL